MAKKASTIAITIPQLSVRKLLIGITIASTLFIGALIASTPATPLVVPISYTLTDQYGGVFSSDTTCDPYSADYSWIAGNVSVVQQEPSGSTASLVVTISEPLVTRSSAISCKWDFFVSISPPDVGAIYRLFGQGGFPQSLGIVDIKLGTETLGSIAPTLGNNDPVNFSRSIAVTNTLYGVARLGDLNASCTGDTGNLPINWECRGRVAWDGYYWIGYYNYDKYRSISKLDYTNTKRVSKCWGVNSYRDFKLGAKVTITGDNGTYTTQLEKAHHVGLPITIPMQNSPWYLSSKSTKVVVCHFAWKASTIAFSKSGYIVTIGKRDPQKVTYEQLVGGDWLVWSDFGNAIPSFTKN